MRSCWRTRSPVTHWASTGTGAAVALGTSKSLEAVERAVASTLVNLVNSDSLPVRERVRVPRQEAVDHLADWGDREGDARAGGVR